jgi:hypothetical protein
MSQELVELKISKSVAALSDESVDHIPVSGKKVQINAFIADGSSGSGLVANLYWKYGQAGETLIWSASAGNVMPFVFKIPDAEVNGTNKIAVVLDNATVSAAFLSGYAYIEVND